MNNQKVKSIRENGQATRDEVLKVVEDYWVQELCSPSMREIARKLNRSTSHVQHALKGLEFQGKIVYENHRHRAITPIWIYSYLLKIRMKDQL